MLRADEPIAFDDIDEATAEFVAWLEGELAALPPITDFEPQVVRDAREEGNSIFGPLVRSDRARHRQIEGSAGTVGLRIIEPATVDGVYLHIHGGGWVLGAADHRDGYLVELADSTNAAVVSVEYRLAPEHPYPAGPDDCEAAAAWLLDAAEAEWGTDQLVIGGESAGAHLSATTLLRLRDRHGDSGFAAANLVYGAYDLGATPSVVNWGDRNLVLSTPIIAWFTDHFVPADLRRNPDVSPLYADLRDLPPALFTVGTLDPLLDDSLFMAAKWVAAGNAAQLDVYPGGVHAFDYFPEQPLARLALDRMFEFVRTAFSS